MIAEMQGEVKNLEIIDNLPALYHGDSDSVVISDLHLGLEGSITYEGGYVPKFQLKDIKSDIRRAKRETNAQNIIINGDLKHDFSKTRFTERKEIDEFIEFLLTIFESITIIKGNHDTFIENIEFDDSVEVKDKYIKSGVLFQHGHKKIDLKSEDFESVVIGHEHPAIVLEDAVGTREKFDCFLHGQIEGKEVWVLPAFSKISGGTNINETPKSELLSPFLRSYGVNNLKATALVRNEAKYEFPKLRKI